MCAKGSGEKIDVAHGELNHDLKEKKKRRKKKEKQKWIQHMEGKILKDGFGLDMLLIYM